MRMLVTVMLAASTISACSSTDPGPSPPAPTPDQSTPTPTPTTKAPQTEKEHGPKVETMATHAPLEGVAAPGDRITTQAQLKPMSIAACGTTTCGENEYCCNESCGVCAPIGGACTQQQCQ